MESLKDNLVSFSPGALKELEKTYLQQVEAQPENLGLRLGVVGGGCAGMSYTLGFDQANEKDLTFNAGVFNVFINKAHSLYLSGMLVDYQDGLNARGFTFVNPNASSTCGCGSSFGI